MFEYKKLGLALVAVSLSGCQALLKVEVGEGGGTVATQQGEINCPTTCQTPLKENSSIALSALPDAGYIFSRWEGCDDVNGMQCTVTTVGKATQSRTVSAVFIRDPKLSDVYHLDNYVNVNVDASNLSGIWMSIESYSYSENDGVQQLYEGSGKFRKLFFIAELASGMVSISNCGVNETITAAGDALIFEDNNGAAYTLSIQSNTRLTGTLQRAEGNTRLPENFSGDIALVKIADDDDQPPTVAGSVSIDDGTTETVGNFAGITCFEERNSTETVRTGETSETTTQHYVKVRGSSNDDRELSFTTDEDSRGLKYNDITIKGAEEVFASADVSQDPELSLSVSTNPDAITVSSQFQVANPEGRNTAGAVNTFTLTLP